MRTLTVLGMGALLLTYLFQCCPCAAPAPPSVRRAEEAAEAVPPSSEDTWSVPTGLSRENPVPLGNTLTSARGEAITVQGIVAQGEEASPLAQEWSMFNEPESGNEYLIISVRVGYEGGPTETLTVSQYVFRVAVGTRIYEHAFLMMEGNELEGEIFEGGSIDGLLVFEVPQGSTGVILLYSAPFDRTYYFATE